jgi:hypothetical protein
MVVKSIIRKISNISEFNIVPDEDSGGKKYPAFSASTKS